VVVALLAVQFVVLGLVQAHRDSAAVDEAVDVASGISIVTRHDFRMNPEHGPLPKVLSALPALFVHPVVPDGESWRSGAWFDFTDDFITANRAAGRLDSVLFAARIVPTLIGAACGVLLFVLGRRLFGPVAGAIAGAHRRAGARSLSTIADPPRRRARRGDPRDGLAHPAQRPDRGCGRDRHRQPHGGHGAT
jgi:hypothetical protein